MTMLNYQRVQGYRIRLALPGKVKHPETMAASTARGNIGPLWGVFNARSYGSKSPMF